MNVMGWVQIREMFIQQSRCTGIEAEGQSSGSGSDVSLRAAAETCAMLGATDLTGNYAVSADSG